MQQITIEDLILINNLSSRVYTGISLASNSTLVERNHLSSIKTKLRTLAAYFADKYSDAYGPFEISVSSGNPMTRGNTFNNVWAGMFKGSINKQYAAQISFVMNKQNTCLDVGFYFGRASGHSVNPTDRVELEIQLNNLGIGLSDSIINNVELLNRYNALFDFGFTAYSNGNPVTPATWFQSIRVQTKNSQIIARVYPNDFGQIENSIIDSFVSQVIFLMSAIRSPVVKPAPIIIKPLTPEQRAKQAERLAQIGQKGELYAMNFEKERLRNLGIEVPNYPRHVALESMHYGYDILSVDEDSNEIFIEVKTTTRNRNDPNSRKFYISNNELEVFQNYQVQYKLYRVYDIENAPALDELNLNEVTKNPDGFIVTY